MAKDPRPLSTEDAILWAQRLNPQTHGASALYILLMQQVEQQLSADTVIEAFEAVARGEPLPALGLSHHGVGVVQEFDDAEWARLKPALLAVAASAPAHTPAYVIEVAQRLLGTREAMLLRDTAAGKLICALLDPTVPPMTPPMLDEVCADLEITRSQVKEALFLTGWARPLVSSQVAAWTS